WRIIEALAVPFLSIYNYFVSRDRSSVISVAFTAISVNGEAVVEAPALRLVTALLDAVADAHTPRSLVRAIATSLASHLPVQRVELGPAAPVAIVERSGDDWLPVDPEPDPKATVLARGLAIVALHPVPAEYTGPEVRAALERVIEAATRHMVVVQR